MARWQLRNNGGTYPLQTEISRDVTQMPFAMDGWSLRVDTGEVFGKPGVYISGDEQVKERNVTFTYQKAATTDTEWRAWVNELLQFVDPLRGPFYLEDTENEIRAEVRFKSASVKPEKVGTENFLMQGELKFVMLTGLFEALTADTDQQSAVENEDEWDIDNQGYFPAYPIFTVTPVDDLTEFTLRNDTTGATITVVNNGMTIGREIEIDTIAGTVTLDGVDITTSIDTGGFWYIAAGVNTIVYESPDGSADVDTTWRPTAAY